MAFDELYQEIILDHYKNPRNFGDGSPSCTAIELDNPVCGDHIRLMLHINGQGLVDDIKFNGSGCAISVASASMMTEEVLGKSVAEAKKILADVLGVARGEKEPDVLDDYGDISALKGVAKFPMRVKCATLSWHALDDALKKLA